MDPTQILESLSFLWQPWVVAALVALAMALIWMSLAPSSKPSDRLDDYGHADAIEETELQKPFFQRAILPGLRRLLRALGSLAPKRNIEATRLLISAAGGLGGMSPLDFLGLRLLGLAACGMGAFFYFSASNPLTITLRNSILAALVGFFIPLLWLNSRVSSRKKAILRALPDALDMLTIGVEAGLAFESAMLRVGEKWRNPLTEEFRRAVAEIRYGMSRTVALQRMSERINVHEVTTFVAILIQSDALGVSIAEVLHSQAAQMRMRRRQRVQELAQQASIKMVFPLVLLIFPSMFIVILGPSIPIIMESLGGAF